MTGGQQSAGTGKLEAICQAVGVEPNHIRVFVPLKKNYEEMIRIIKEEIDYQINFFEVKIKTINSIIKIYNG